MESLLQESALQLDTKDNTEAYDCESSLVSECPVLTLLSIARLSSQKLHQLCKSANMMYALWCLRLQVLSLLHALQDLSGRDCRLAGFGRDPGQLTEAHAVPVKS